MKKTALFLILTLLISLFCSCAKPQQEDINIPTIDASNVSILGNTNGNLLCSGLFAQESNRIYFATNGLYSISESGDDWVQVYDGKASSVNIVNGNIYCTLEDASDTRIIHKINISSGEAQKLADDDVQSLTVANGNIYFSSKSENAIFKMDLSGANRTKLFDAYAWNISYDNEFLYFVAEDGKYQIHKIDTNGENHSILYDGEVISLTVDKGVVYFSCADENALGIYKLDENGTPVSIVPTIPMRMNVHSGYVYYTTAEGLFKCSTDGGTPLLIAQESINHIYVGGGRIYYTLNDMGTSKLYRVKLDGSENQLFLTLVVE